MIPRRVLTIAGSDPSGGAGLQADLKAIQAVGGYGMAVVTALTAQNTCGVTGVHAPPAEFVDAQLGAILDDCPPDATKTGMLFSADVVAVVAVRARSGALGRLVVDPVMVATSGDRLLRPEAERALRASLLPLAEIVTPNRAELAVLSELPTRTLGESLEAAARLVNSGVAAVLVKGGHGDEADVVVDALVRATVEPVLFERTRLALEATHGTGCTLSAVLAACLARGDDLVTAVRRAGDFVHAGLADAFPVGRGAVPVNHISVRARESTL